MGPLPGASTRPQGTAYVTPAEFDFRALLPGPPTDDSPEHKAEVDRMLSMQADRTPAQELRCKSQEEVTVFAFAEVLGPWFTPSNVPQTTALMSDVYEQTRQVSGAAKIVWKRTRPPLADPRIHPCVELERTFSYPSGHATRGIVWAMLLSEIFPEKREGLMTLGREIGTNRALAGMHYPSDVLGGQMLGEEIAHRLLANPDFRERLKAAKKECWAAWGK
jgi:acid phosphatase (class A)